MSQVYPYVFFDGTCREAMTFYQSCLGGELTLLPVGETPMAAQMPPEMHHQILHSMLRSGEFTLMASDMLGPEGVVRGNDVHLCLVCGSKDEIEAHFERLAAGGQVGHALNEEFFGTFGDLTDRFGVRWMLQFSPNPQG
jgi:PhnB protein